MRTRWALALGLLASLALVATAGSDVAPAIRPLEAEHLGSRNYRNACETNRLTATHWHIAWANGLGWGFDGMDGAILALVAPLLMKEFAIDLGTYRSGVQIALFVSIAGLYLWTKARASVAPTFDDAPTPSEATYR